MLRACFQILAASSSLAVMAVATGAPQAEPKVCADLKPLFTTQPNQRLYSLILYGEDKDGVQRFSGVDIDHDGKPDALELSCPGSTIEPGDPCLLDVHPSSGSPYAVEGMPLYLLQYKRRVYAVAGNIDEWPDTQHVRLLRLSSVGPRVACTFVLPAR